MGGGVTYPTLLPQVGENLSLISVKVDFSCQTRNRVTWLSTCLIFIVMLKRDSPIIYKKG